MVYVFRSYPVVKIIANVIPLTKELKVTDSSFKFKVCWSLESKFQLQNDAGNRIIFVFCDENDGQQFPNQFQA